MRHTKSIDDAILAHDVITSYSKTNEFRSSARKRKVGVFKNLHSGEHFWKVPFLRTVFTWYVWTIGQIGKKIRFQTKPLGINRSSNCHCSLGDTVLLSDETNFLALFCVSKSGFLPHFQSVWEFNFSLTWLPVSCPLRPRASSANFYKLSFSS